MSVVPSVTPGVNLGPLPFSATASSRKEKKKQAKEERDRLKQAEKKKRRLEKALATAVAIRTELEKKKQRRKEEEQRLDEEGAALAEAVALQVSCLLLYIIYRMAVYHPSLHANDFVCCVYLIVHNLNLNELEWQLGDIGAELLSMQKAKVLSCCLDKRVWMLRAFSRNVLFLAATIGTKKQARIVI